MSDFIAIKDGNEPSEERHVEVKTAKGHKFIAAYSFGFLNSDDKDCWCWVAMDGDDAPDCWTGGVCWEVNEDDVPSDQVIAFRELN